MLKGRTSWPSNGWGLFPKALLHPIGNPYKNWAIAEVLLTTYEHETLRTIVVTAETQTFNLREWNGIVGWSHSGQWVAHAHGILPGHLLERGKEKYLCRQHGGWWGCTIWDFVWRLLWCGVNHGIAGKYCNLNVGFVTVFHRPSSLQMHAFGRVNCIGQATELHSKYSSARRFCLLRYLLSVASFHRLLVVLTTAATIVVVPVSACLFFTNASTWNNDFALVMHHPPCSSVSGGT